MNTKAHQVEVNLKKGEIEVTMVDMSKIKQWNDMYQKMSKKRLGKREAGSNDDYITVQRLSAHVEGKAQKYTRIGLLTMLPMNGREKTLEAVNDACIQQLDIKR